MLQTNNENKQRRVFMPTVKGHSGSFVHTYVTWLGPITPNHPPPPQVTSGPHFFFTDPHGVSCWFHKQRSDRAPHRWAHDAAPEWDDLSIPVHHNLPGDDSPTLQGEGGGCSSQGLDAHEPL